MTEQQLQALQRMSVLDSYYRWVYQLVAKWVGRRVLDAGCGVGNFTACLVPHSELIIAADLSLPNIEILKKRFADAPQVSARQLDLGQSFEDLTAFNLDTVVCLDVLEHLEDDVGLLKKFYQMVQPGGHLIVKVPACEFLFGTLDITSGHHRRYSRAKIAACAQAAGWKIIVSKYMNIFGVLPYWWKSRVLKKQSTFSLTFKPWQLKLIRILIPIMSKIDSLLHPPIGLSVVLVAQKPV